MNQHKNPFESMILNRRNYRLGGFGGKIIAYNDYLKVKDQPVIYTNISELIAMFTSGGKSSLINKQISIGWFDILTDITSNHKLDKKDVTKIFTCLNKLDEGKKLCEPFGWIKNLERDGLLDDGKKATLIRLGYVVSYDDKAHKFSEKEIDAMFSLESTLKTMEIENEKFKDFLFKNKFKLKNTNLLLSFSISKVSATKTSYFSSTLNFFEFCNYKFTQEDLFNCLQTMKAESGCYDYNYKKYMGLAVTAVVKFFNKVNINIDLNMLLKIIENEQVTYSCVSKGIILLTGNLVEKKAVDDNVAKRIMMIKNTNLLNAMIDYFNIELSDSMILSAIIRNDLTTIKKALDCNKLKGINKDVAFKYACMNCHEQLIQYYLNNKYIPKREHVIYVVASNDKTKIKNIIHLFCSYGLSINKEIFEVLACKLGSSNYLNTLKISITNEVRDQIHRKITNIYGSDYNGVFEPEKKLPFVANTLDIIIASRSCKNVIEYLMVNNEKLTQEMMEKITYSMPGMLATEYLYDNFQYVPDIFTILRHNSVSLRLLYMMKFHDFTLTLLNEENKSQVSLDIEKVNNKSDNREGSDSSRSDEEDQKPKKIVKKLVTKKKYDSDNTDNDSHVSHKSEEEVKPQKATKVVKNVKKSIKNPPKSQDCNDDLVEF